MCARDLLVLHVLVLVVIITVLAGGVGGGSGLVTSSGRLGLGLVEVGAGSKEVAQLAERVLRPVVGLVSKDCFI